MIRIGLTIAAAASVQIDLQIRGTYWNTFGLKSGSSTAARRPSRPDCCAVPSGFSSNAGYSALPAKCRMTTTRVDHRYRRLLMTMILRNNESCLVGPADQDGCGLKDVHCWSRTSGASFRSSTGSKPAPRWSCRMMEASCCWRRQQGVGYRGSTTEGSLTQPGSCPPRHSDLTSSTPLFLHQYSPSTFQRSCVL